MLKGALTEFADRLDVRVGKIKSRGLQGESERLAKWRCHSLRWQTLERRHGFPTGTRIWFRLAWKSARS